MPIRPENKARYPADWQQVRQRILLRANFQCEHPGCRAMHGTIGYWYDGAFRALHDKLWHAGYRPGDVLRYAEGGAVYELKVIRIVLTIAHLDHQPENCSDDNLRAWCQRHHLAYDAKHHQVTRYRTRHAAARTVDMFPPERI
jgi:hypothetical protein